MSEHTPQRAYRLQQYSTRARGIAFKFSFRSWVAWWRRHLGPDWFKKRGPRRHQFVMARHKDEGSYEIKNVKCITAAENGREGYFNKTYATQQRKKADWEEWLANYKPHF